MKNTFAIVCEWPKGTTAENETIARIKKAAVLINKELLVIDKYGNILDSDLNVTGGILKNQDVDFVINLHFASPKCYDGFSYVALWNPVKFYHDWGYKEYSNNLITHHDFISCLSDPADDHALRISHINNSKHLKPEMVINHTNCGPYHEPGGERSHIFYCGINWDAGSGKSRFSNIFTDLDRKDVLKIYGPRRLPGFIPWKGFKSYVGEIPFDGESTFEEMSKCLLGLALSHDAHIESEIASSRVFELISGGVLPICDENPFFKKYFGSKVLYVSGNQKEKAGQILTHYQWATDNRGEVVKMVGILQDYVRERFELATQLKDMYDRHINRRTLIENRYCALTNKFKVNLVYICDGGKSDGDLENIKLFQNQIYQNIKLVIVSNSYDLTDSVNELGLDHVIIRHSLGIGGLGLILEKVKNSIPEGDGQLFLITDGRERIFYDHIASLVREFEDNDSCEVVESGFVVSNERVSINTDKPCVGSIIFKSFPPDFILKYLSRSNYSRSMKSFFEEGYRSISVNTVELKDEEGAPESRNSLSHAMFLDYKPAVNGDGLENLKVSKDLAYDIISRIKFLSPLVKIRNKMSQRRRKRREKKMKK